MGYTERIFVVGMILLLTSCAVFAGVPSISAQDNSKLGSFGLGATVSVQVDRATTQPTVIAPLETSLPYIIVGVVIGIAIASFFMLLLVKFRRKTATASRALVGGEKA